MLLMTSMLFKSVTTASETHKPHFICRARLHSSCGWHIYQAVPSIAIFGG